MRRVVDSVILLLVVYSVGFPLFRGMTGPGIEARGFVARIAGLDAVPAVSMRFARSEREARRGDWIGECEQSAGSTGATLHGRHAADAGWVEIAMQGTPVDAHVVPDTATSATTTLTLTDTVRVLIGTVEPHHRKLSIAFDGCHGERIVDVSCDANGRFVAALPSGLGDVLHAAIRTTDGNELHRMSIDAADRIVDAGAIAERATPRGH